VTGVTVIEEDVMDWRYPIRILDTETVAGMKGKAFEKIRNKFSQASKHIQALSFTHDSGLEMMRAALKFWEGNMIANLKETEDMSALYEELFQVVQAYPDSARVIMFQQGRRPAGFTVWDEPCVKTANLLVNLGDTSITGLSDFQLVSACKTLRDQGVQYLNMGGSELETLDAFKAKYQPVQTLKVLSAEVVYSKPDNPHIKVHTIVPGLDNPA